MKRKQSEAVASLQVLTHLRPVCWSRQLHRIRLNHRCSAELQHQYAAWLANTRMTRFAQNSEMAIGALCDRCVPIATRVFTQISLFHIVSGPVYDSLPSWCLRMAL